MYPSNFTIPIQKIQDDDWCTFFAVPVTLRQVEEAGILLNSRFGINKEERDELLDGICVLRLVFGVRMYEDYEIIEEQDIEVLEMRYLIDDEPIWRSATTPNRLHRADDRNNRVNIGCFAYQLLGDRFMKMVSKARKRFDDWVKEVEKAE